MDYLKGMPPLWPQPKDGEEILVTYPPKPALALLRHCELCIVTIDGIEREAAWSTISNRFFFTSEPAGSVKPDEVEEWRPAGVKF